MRSCTRMRWKTQRAPSQQWLTAYATHRFLFSSFDRGFSRCSSSTTPATSPPALKNLSSRELISLDHPLLSNYTQGLHPASPPPDARHDQQSWTRLLEPCLPEDLRKHDHHEPTRSLALAVEILRQARETSNHDLLTYLGEACGRWDAAVWLACAIIRGSFAPSKPWRIPDVLTSLQWPECSLDEFSAMRLTSSAIKSGDDLGRRPQNSSLTTSESWSLHENLGLRRTNDYQDPAAKARKKLGHVWVSLGRMVFAAVEREEQEAVDIVSKLIMILRSFHEKGYLPDNLGREVDPLDKTALQQPPIVAQLSGHVSGTSTQAWHDGNKEIRPVFWLEYILWCCIHGGWLMEAATIISAQGRFSQNGSWALDYWRQIPELNGDLPGYPGMARPTSGNSDPAVSKKRKISTEVVIALTDGLATTLEDDNETAAYPVEDVVRMLGALRQILYLNKMSLGTFTWDSIIARVCDSCAGRTVSRKLTVVESMLGFASTFDNKVRPGNASTAEGKDCINYDLDGSAAVLGIFHRTLHTYIRARDVDGALRVLAALQTLTDRSKAQSLSQFFLRLKRQDDPAAPKFLSAPAETSRQHLSPAANYPGFFPNLPINVLAALLDLLNDCNAIELGSWLIYSSDIDGPLIPEHEHGNQVIAPALIRFAATTSDTELLRKLTRVQTTSISGLTLVALCETRIRQGDFRHASEVLGLIRDYALHVWTTLDLTRVLRALLLQVYGVNATRKLDDARSLEAAVLIQRLLRGDLGQVWGEGSFSRIDTIVDVLCSVDPYLADLCANLMPRGQNYKADLSSEAFVHLLDGVVKIWGSEKGKEVWLNWCSDSIHDPLQASRSESSRWGSIANLFSVGSEEVATELDIHMLPGRIKPSLLLMKAIVLQALEEQRHGLSRQLPLEDDDSAEAQQYVRSHQHPILDWALQVLRHDFQLSDADIDYELQGYLSAMMQDHNIAQPKNYSPETARIWRAFAGPRKRWALDAEHSLRTLARTAGGNLVFEEPAAERVLLLSLSKDLGLIATTHGEGELRSVVVTRPGRDASQPRVPVQMLDDVVRFQG